MGAEFEVGSLEEMCRLMCDNYIPRRKPHKCGECKHLSNEKCSIGYRCVNPEKKLKWKSPTAMWKYKHTPACRMFELKEERDQMTNKEAIEELKKVDTLDMPARLCEAHYMAIKALKQEPKTGWNNHQIACMLADLFGDACACNYNGIDEWLGELCDFKDTCCPNPVGVACWEQFLKYSQSRYTECGYEVRDKNALQEPKAGHCKDCKYFEYDSVAKVDGIPIIVAHEMCSRWGDGCKTREDGYCFLFEPQESEDKHES